MSEGYWRIGTLCTHLFHVGLCRKTGDTSNKSTSKSFIAKLNKPKAKHTNPTAFYLQHNSTPLFLSLSIGVSLFFALRCCSSKSNKEVFRWSLLFWTRRNTNRQSKSIYSDQKSLHGSFLYLC